MNNCNYSGKTLIYIIEGVRFVKWIMTLLILWIIKQLYQKSTN